MKKKLLIFIKTEIFKHWHNKAWSTFNSIGKHIIISALPLTYFTALSFNSEAQTDTVQMQEVQINSARIPTLYSESARIVYTIDKKDIEAMPVNSVQDLLEYITSVDVRQRGNEGVQADININGGNFNQTLILLNGFKINDIQTGHHNLNLPVDIENIEKVEILEGPGNRVFGINAYSGAINFITDSQTAEQLKAGIFAGMHNYFGGNISISHNFKNFNNYLSASYKKSDGYINNTDFNILNFFYQNQFLTKFANYSFQTGYTDKSFGANSFYTPEYPLQYEETKTFFAGLKSEKQSTHYKLTHLISLRRHQDRFELFREDTFKHIGNYFIDGNDTAKYIPGIYETWNYYPGHNYHLTYNFNTELKLNLYTKAGKSALGIEYMYSKIKSNVLGEPLENPETVPGEPDGIFTKSVSRTNLNVYAEHVIKLNKIIISGGASLNFDTHFKQNFSGGIDLSYALTKHLKSFASINQSARLPTFTDLYYNGPSNKGNPDLLPETALNYETGIKYFRKNIQAHASVFMRNGKNTIDRVRLSDTTDWQALNITELTTIGAEFTVNYTFSPASFLKHLNFSYAYTNIVKQSNDYISKYASNYLKHKAVFSLNHKIYRNLSANWKVRYENREGSFSVYDITQRRYTEEQNYKPFTLADVRLLWHNKRFEIYADASNIFNVQYRDFGDIMMPGREIKAGIKININY